MEVNLVVKRGASSKRVMRLKSEETIVGRRKDCDLRIRSAEVSRRHCLLSYQDGILHVEDLDSVNGTFVNHERVTGRQVVRPGDELEIGPIRFVVEYEISGEARNRLKSGEVEAAGAEDLDVLPVVNESDQENFSFAEGAEEELDALPFTDEDTEFSQSKPQNGEEVPEAQAAGEDEPLPMADEIMEGRDWNLPQSNDLRDILTQMDDPKPKKRPKADD